MKRLNKEEFKNKVKEIIFEVLLPQDLEYVSYLQEHVSNCLNGRYKINETRGINEDIDFIVQKIIKLVKNNIQDFKFNIIGKFSNIRTKEDCFIDVVNVDVMFTSIDGDKYKMKSFFNGEKCKFVENRNGKIIMFYPYFNFNELVPSIIHKPVLNEQIFSVNVWHEVMHCYRIYKIYLDNDNVYPHSLNIIDTRYRKALTLMHNNDSSSCGKIAKWIGNCYYKMNQNEIAAQVSSIYGYIKTHKEINVNNYKEYLNELDIKQTYNSILQLYNYIEEIRNRKKNNSEKPCVVSILKKLFKIENEDDSIVLKRTSNNIKYYLSYINNKMYAAIEYSLMALRRNGITAEMYAYTPELMEVQERPKWEGD